MRDLSFFELFLTISVEYYVLAFIIYYLFYKIYNNKLVRIKIQKAFPKDKDFLRELIYSSISMLIFTVIGYILFFTKFTDYTKIYADPLEKGIGYFIFSIVLMAVLDDTFFYWMHRLYHHPKLFKYVHLVHHQSNNPNPLTAYSLHPFEAILTSSFFVIISFVFPINYWAVSAYMFFTLIHNFYGHLGYEILPTKLIHSKLGKWLNTSINHNQHHKFFDHNYGLYFRFWDEMMGTTHPGYNELVDKIKPLDEELKYKNDPKSFAHQTT